MSGHNTPDSALDDPTIIPGPDFVGPPKPPTPQLGPREEAAFRSAAAATEQNVQKVNSFAIRALEHVQRFGDQSPYFEIVQDEVRQHAIELFELDILQHNRQNPGVKFPGTLQFYVDREFERIGLGSDQARREIKVIEENKAETALAGAGVGVIKVGKTIEQTAELFLPLRELTFGIADEGIPAVLETERQKQALTSAPGAAAVGEFAGQLAGNLALTLAGGPTASGVRVALAKAGVKMSQRATEIVALTATLSASGDLIGIDALVQAKDAGFSDSEALLEFSLAAATTAMTGKLLGFRGVQVIARPGGAEAIRQLAFSLQKKSGVIFKGGIEEALQEGGDSFLQRMREIGRIRPDLTVEQIMREVIFDTAVGFGTGAAIRGALEVPFLTSPLSTRGRAELEAIPLATEIVRDAQSLPPEQAVQLIAQKLQALREELAPTEVTRQQERDVDKEITAFTEVERPTERTDIQLVEGFEEIEPTEAPTQITEIQEGVPEAQDVQVEKRVGAVFGRRPTLVISSAVVGGNNLDGMSEEDVADELQFMQELADRGKLTMERVRNTEIWKRLDISLANEVREAIEKDPAATISELQEVMRLRAKAREAAPKRGRGKIQPKPEPEPVQETIPTEPPILAAEPEEVVPLAEAREEITPEPEGPKKEIIRELPIAEVRARAKEAGIPVGKKPKAQLIEAIESEERVPRLESERRAKGEKFFTPEFEEAVFPEEIAGVKTSPVQATVARAGTNGVPVALASEEAMQSGKAVARLENGNYVIVTRNEKGKLGIPSAIEFNTLEAAVDGLIDETVAPGIPGQLEAAQEIAASAKEEAAVTEQAKEGLIPEEAREENIRNAATNIARRAQAVGNEAAVAEAFAIIENPSKAAKGRLAKLAKEAGFDSIADAAREFTKQKRPSIESNNRAKQKALERKGARTQEDPVEGPTNIRGVAKTMADGLNTFITTSSSGAYSDAGAALINVENLDTRDGLSQLTHEIGHDTYWAVTSELVPTQDELFEIAEELKVLAEPELRARDVSIDEATENLILREGAAEHMRIWLEGDRAKLKKQAPKYTALLEKYFLTHPDVEITLDDVRLMITALDALETEDPIKYSMGKIVEQSTSHKQTFMQRLRDESADMFGVLYDMDRLAGVDRSGIFSTEAMGNRIARTAPMSQGIIFTGVHDPNTQKKLSKGLLEIIEPLSHDEKRMLEVSISYQRLVAQFEALFGLDLSDLVTRAKREGITDQREINRWIEDNFREILVNEVVNDKLIIADRHPSSQIAIIAIIDATENFTFVKPKEEQDGMDLTKHKDFLAGGHAETIVRSIQEMPQNIKDAANDIFQYTDALLTMASTNGYLTQAEADVRRAITGGKYIPLNRELSDILQDASNPTFNPFNASELIGSTKLILHPLDTLQEITHAMVYKRTRNTLFDGIFALNEFLIQDGKTNERFITMMDRKTAEEMNQSTRNELGIKRFVISETTADLANKRIVAEEKRRKAGTLGDRPRLLPKFGEPEIEGGMGEIIWIKFNDPVILASLQYTSGVLFGGNNIFGKDNLFTKLLTAPTNVFRTLAVGINPVFIAAEIVRTPFEIVLNSRGRISFKKRVDAFFETVFKPGQTEELARLRAGGGLPGSFAGDFGPNMTGIPKYEGMMGALRKGLDVLSARMARVNEGYRLGELRSVMDVLFDRRADPDDTAIPENTSDEQLWNLGFDAAANSTYNPKQIGRTIRPINQVVAFINAPINETLKQWRNLKERKATFISRLTFLVAAPQMLLMAMRALAWDEEDWKRVNQIPENTLDAYFYVPLPKSMRDATNSPGFFVAKPFGWAGAFATMVDRWTRENTDGLDKDAAFSILANVSPLNNNLTPTAFAPLLDAFTGFNMAFNKPIEPRRLMDVDDTLAFTSDTSDTMVVVAGWLEAIGAPEAFARPENLERIVTGYTAGIGRGALDYSDEFVRNIQGRAMKPRRGLVEFIPGVGQMIAKDKSFWSRDMIRLINNLDRFGGTSADLRQLTNLLISKRIEAPEFKRRLKKAIGRDGDDAVVDGLTLGMLRLGSVMKKQFDAIANANSRGNIFERRIAQDVLVADMAEIAHKINKVIEKKLGR